MPDITYMRVTGRWTRIIDDRPGDVDDKPDEVGLTGVVTFTPQLGGLPSLPAGSPSRSVTIDEVKALVVDGVLEDLQSRPGVWLAAQVGGQDLFWTASTALRWSGTRLPAQRVTFGPPPAGQTEVHLNDKLIDDTVELPAPVIGQAQAAAAAAAQSAAAAAQSAADAEAAGGAPSWDAVTGKPAAIAAGATATAARAAIGAAAVTSARLAARARPAPPAVHGGCTLSVSASPPGWISRYVTASMQGTRFRVVGPPLAYESVSQAYWAAWNGANLGANVVSHEETFFLQGSKVCAMVYSYGDQDMQFLVDGKLAKPSYTVLPNQPQYSFVTLEFTDDTSALAVREIRAFMGQVGLVQWLLPAGGDMWACRTPRLTIGIVASDSFTHGAGGTSEGSISAGSMAMEMAICSGGTVEVINGGSQGGTGGVNAATGTTATVGPNGQTAYGSAVRVAAAQAWVDQCDVLTIQGGANDADFSTYPLPGTVSAFQAAWSAYRALAPTKPLIVIGVEGNVFPAAATQLDQLNAALKSAAQASPAVTAYVDQRALGVVFGTGNIAAKNGSGNADVLVSSDGIHLDRAGCRAIAISNLGEVVVVAVTMTEGAVNA